MNNITDSLNSPIDAFIFDCDGTLSLIEGIEVLAEQNGVGPRVHELTAYAMGEAGLCSTIYQERLTLVRPNRRQVIELAQNYFASRAPDSIAVIEALHALDKAVYVVSAGVNPAVRLFATMLGIPAEHVFAVDLKFSMTGDYEGYDQSAYPTENNGKRIIAHAIKERHERLIWIGDGMNDLIVKPDVARFIGYGGAFYRPKIAQHSDFYLTCQSMAPLLALGLTHSEIETLEGKTRALYTQGLELIEAGDVEINSHIMHRNTE